MKYTPMQPPCDLCKATFDAAMATMDIPIYLHVHPDYILDKPLAKNTVCWGQAGSCGFWRNLSRVFFASVVVFFAAAAHEATADGIETFREAVYMVSPKYVDIPNKSYEPKGLFEIRKGLVVVEDIESDSFGLHIWDAIGHSKADWQFPTAINHWINRIGNPSVGSYRYLPLNSIKHRWRSAEVVNTNFKWLEVIGRKSSNGNAGLGDGSEYERFLKPDDVVLLPIQDFGLFPHDIGLTPIREQLQERDHQESRCDNDGPPFSRRILIGVGLLIGGFHIDLWGRSEHYRGLLVGRLARLAGLGTFALGLALWFLTGFSWSWGWWI